MPNPDEAVIDAVAEALWDGQMVVLHWKAAVEIAATQPDSDYVRIVPSFRAAATRAIAAYDAARPAQATEGLQIWPLIDEYANARIGVAVGLGTVDRIDVARTAVEAALAPSKIAPSEPPFSLAFGAHLIFGDKASIDEAIRLMGDSR